MSPEQASGVKTVDRRTDIYAMGVMLYEILTGKLPFSGASPMEVMIKTSKDPVVPPSKITSIQINPIHFKTLEAVCLKALAKDPADRYDTAEQFAADLSRWLKGQDFRPANLKTRRILIGAAAAVVVLGVFFSVLWHLKPWRIQIEGDLARADALLAEGKADEALILYSKVVAHERDNVRAEQGRQSALLKLQPKASTPPAPVPASWAKDPWKDSVELLRLVDLSKDVVSGRWSRKSEGLVSEGGKPSRIQIPYRPPEEYDLRIVFARHSANFCVNLILSQSGEPFTLVMHRDGYFGFEKVADQDFHKNATTKRFDGPLQKDREYTVVAEVRRSGVKTFCEGIPLSRLDTYEAVTMNKDWKMPDPAALGVGTWDGGAEIKKLEIREVTGKGAPAR
jgi:hypothetical protein